MTPQQLRLVGRAKCQRARGMPLKQTRRILHGPTIRQQPRLLPVLRRRCRRRLNSACVVASSSKARLPHSNRRGAADCTCVQRARQQHNVAIQKNQIIPLDARIARFRAADRCPPPYPDAPASWQTRSYPDKPSWHPPLRPPTRHPPQSAHPAAGSAPPTSPPAAANAPDD